MSQTDFIIKRRSVRKYSGKDVSDEQIVEMIKAGMFAPSAVNKQPWHFMVLRDKELFAKLVEIHPNSRMLMKASGAILVLRDKQLEHSPGYGTQDLAAATENILLAAHGMEIGTCWIGIYPREERIDLLKNLLELPDHIEAFSMISIGYPDYVKNLPEERFQKERIHFDKW